jgi:phage gp29-like protein
MTRTRKSPATRQAAANTAPAATGEPLQTSAQALRVLRQNKHNPLPFLSPETLTRALENFERGYLRDAALLWEKMAERDDVLASVKPKREKDVSQLDMQVTVEPDSGEAGMRHQEVLERFWTTCRAVNAYDRNEHGGFRRLIKQMMTATSYRYAAHHIVWSPRPDGELRATFEFVPLWLFENTTGRLRYLAGQASLTGEELTPGEWMVTTGDGLMIACSIGYLAKRSAMNDWLIFSGKFAVPGVLGRTSAKSGTAEAIAMQEATQAFGNDWCAVITGDDGAHGKPIEIIQAQGGTASMPMPAVIERVDRRMAALYRGADLSSMSSGTEGQGTGASLQDTETDLLRRDDAETITETLAEISRMVIEWHFGNGTAPLARVELIVPVAEDASQIINSAVQLADRGAQVSVSALMERLNLPAANDATDALRGVAAQVIGQESRVIGQEPPVANAASAPVTRDPSTLDVFRDSLAADLKPLGDALFQAYQEKDWPAVTAALGKIAAAMPQYAGDAEETAATLAAEMAAAYLGEPEPETES